MMVELLLYVVGFLCVAVIVMGFLSFDEWEIGIEFIHLGYNNFEIGVSNRNYHLENEGVEQELRFGFLFFSLVMVFRRFDA
jgi:hypothetical protein